MPSEPDGISRIHGVVIGRERRVTILPLPIPSADDAVANRRDAWGANLPSPAGCLIMLARGTMMA
jgi:hypothetical protein